MIQVWRTPSDIPACLGGESSAAAASASSGIASGASKRIATGASTGSPAGGYPGTALTIGIFDGVHQGHQAVLARTVAVAHERGLLPMALTFDPHPLKIHRPHMPLHLLTSLEERIQRLEKAGIEAVYIQHYTADYAAISPEDFVCDQLVQLFKAKAVIVGEDVRFGAANRGDGTLLQELGERYGYSVELIPDVRSHEGRRWSSTWVRELLDKGDVEGAARALGRAHHVRGIVQRGFQRGRKLGFPTANLAGSDSADVPADGVYAGWVIVSEHGGAQRLPAAISVGTNPQFDAKDRTVEAHVLGRADLNLYGQEIDVEFVQRLRPMLKLHSVAELQVQMDEDICRSAHVLGVPATGRIDPAAVTAC